MSRVQKCESQEDEHLTLSKTHTFTSTHTWSGLKNDPTLTIFYFPFASFPVIIEPSLFLGGCSSAWTSCSVTFFRMSLIVLLSSGSAACAEASRTSGCSFRESELISSIQTGGHFLYLDAFKAGAAAPLTVPGGSRSGLEQVQSGVG